MFLSYYINDEFCANSNDNNYRIADMKATAEDTVIQWSGQSSRRYSQESGQQAQSADDGTVSVQLNSTIAGHETIRRLGHRSLSTKTLRDLSIN